MPAAPGIEQRLRQAIERAKPLMEVADALTRLEAALNSIRSPGALAVPATAPDGTVAEQPNHSGQIPEGRVDAPSAPESSQEARVVSGARKALVARMRR